MIPIEDFYVPKYGLHLCEVRIPTQVHTTRRPIDLDLDLENHHELSILDIEADHQPYMIHYYELEYSTAMTTGGGGIYYVIVTPFDPITSSLSIASPEPGAAAGHHLRIPLTNVSPIILEEEQQQDEDEPEVEDDDDGEDQQPFLFLIDRNEMIDLQLDLDMDMPLGVELNFNLDFIQHFDPQQVHPHHNQNNQNDIDDDDDDDGIVPEIIGRSLQEPWNWN